VPGTVLADGKLTHVFGAVAYSGKTAHEGDVVKDGEKVTTGPGALAIVETDGGNVKLKMDSDSELTVGHEGGTPEAILGKGGAFAQVAHQNGRVAFKLKTRTATMGVRGTQFYTAWSTGPKGDKDLWMCVNEGLVDLTPNGGAAMPVKAGEGVMLPKGEKPTPPKSYPWTKKLNWNMDAKAKAADLRNQPDWKSAYGDPLTRDVD